MAESGVKRGVPRPVLGVVFDVDGTLYHQQLLRLIMVAHFAVVALMHPRRAIQELRVIRQYRHAQELLRGCQSPSIRTSRSQEATAAQATGQSVEFVAAVVRRWMEEAPLPRLPLCARRRLLRHIKAWHRMGVPMAVYSDYPAQAKLKALGIGSLFRAVVCSTDAEVGCFKPSPRGFAVASAKLGLQPADLVYVGDRADVDGVGAGDSGMGTLIVGLGVSSWRRRREHPMTLRSLDSEIRKTYRPLRGYPCWVCGASSADRFRPSTLPAGLGPGSLRITDSLYGHTAALRKCTQCGFVFAEELPMADMVDQYRAMEDPEYQATAAARRLQMRRILDTVLRLRPGVRTLLDVGAGTGLLVLEARERGLHAHGLEPSRWCVDAAAKHNGVLLLCGTLEEYADRLESYDIITFIDLIEHVRNPLALLRLAAQKLARGGLLVIVTPDIASAAARFMGRWWWHHRVAHVGYFSVRSMRYALQLCGLEEVMQRYTGWRFPLPYLCPRLAQYLRVPPCASVLNRLADSKFLSARELNLNLLDSRLFVAGRKADR